LSVVPIFFFILNNFKVNRQLINNVIFFLIIYLIFINR
jgi:hypothetical protein